MAVAAVLMLAPMANAQSVNEASWRAKLEKSNADIENPKKNTKAATWMVRSKVYFESLQAPTKNLFMDLLDQVMLPTNMGGEPKSKTAEYWEYPWVKVYFNGSKVKAWEQTKFVDENAGAVAIEALVKAYELYVTDSEGNRKLLAEDGANFKQTLNFAPDYPISAIELKICSDYGNNADIHVFSFDFR